MSFPITKRQLISFRHTDTGLTPVFVRFIDLTTMLAVAPPLFVEIGGGTYFFDWTWAASTDHDIEFEVDGGPSIPTIEVRYVTGMITPREFFISSVITGGGGGGSMEVG